MEFILFIDACGTADNKKDPVGARHRGIDAVGIREAAADAIHSLKAVAKDLMCADGVPHEHTYRHSALEQICDHMPTDTTGGSGD